MNELDMLTAIHIDLAAIGVILFIGALVIIVCLMVIIDRLPQR